MSPEIARVLEVARAEAADPSVVGVYVVLVRKGGASKFWHVPNEAVAQRLWDLLKSTLSWEIRP